MLTSHLSGLFSEIKTAQISGIAFKLAVEPQSYLAPLILPHTFIQKAQRADVTFIWLLICVGESEMWMSACEDNTTFVLLETNMLNL